MRGGHLRQTTGEKDLKRNGKQDRIVHNAIPIFLSNGNVCEFPSP